MTTDTQPIDVEQIAASLDCLTAAQLCRLGDISESTADAWRRRGTGPAFVRFGNAVLYPRKHVAEFLLQNVRERRAVETKGVL